MKQYIFLFILFAFFNTQAQKTKKIIIHDSLRSTEELKLLNKRLSRKEFSEKNFKEVLNKEGYLDYSILRIDSLKNEIHIFSKLGNKKKAITIKPIKNNKLPEEITKLIKNETTIKYIDTENYLSNLSQQISELGYPFNNLKLTNIKRVDSSKYIAKLLIDFNNKRNIDKIIVKGYNNFPTSFIKHFLNIKKNQNLSIEKLRKKSNRIKNLQFAEEIKPPEILFTTDSTNVYLYLNKKNANNFDGFLGFNSNEDSKKLKLNGYLNLNLINNLNYGERLSIIYKSDESEQKNLNATIETPYLFNSPIGVEASLNIFNRDSSFTNTTTNIKSVYRSKNKYNIKAGYESIKSNLNTSETTINELDYQSSYFTSEFEFETLDNKSLVNISKTNILIGTKFGNRTTEKSKISQTDLLLTAKNRFYLNNKNAVEIKNQTSYLISDNYLTNELKRFGGINTIRGFNENSIEASLYSILNIEYHYQLNTGLNINSITDFGYFENNVTRQKQQLYSFGVGLSALTKAGILKMTLANGSFKNEKIRFRNSNIHLSLTSFF